LNVILRPPKDLAVFPFEEEFANIGLQAHTKHCHPEASEGPCIQINLSKVVYLFVDP
jgi:hypothetical protein